MTGNQKEWPVALTIAGSDSCGGAGIQADLKTMLSFRVYGMSVVTAVTAQNTCGVMAVEKISGKMIDAQLQAVLEDVPPDAVKIGMLSTAESCLVVKAALEKYRPHHVVLDPVMISTSGRRLLDREAEKEMVRLFADTELITPNLPEAEGLTGIAIHNAEDMEQAAYRLYEQHGCAVLLKGGHLRDTADDLLCDDGRMHWYPANRIVCQNTHGTGCTLSSAIASGLALGYSLQDAVQMAKEYVRQAMSAGMDLGQGNGPLSHGWNISSANACIASKSERE